MVNIKATVRIKTKSGIYPVYIRFTKKKQTSYIKIYRLFVKHQLSLHPLIGLVLLLSAKLLRKI